MVSSRYSVLFLCVFVLLSCSDSKTLGFVPEDGTILAFGDSLTAGLGVSEQDSYPVVLERLSERKVVSAGVSGEETSQGVERLPELLQEVKPDLLILLEGGNDILRNRSPQVIKNNLARMIEQAQLNNVQVVLVGVPEKKLFSSVAPYYEELAQQYDIVLVDDLLSKLLKNNEYKSDAVHLNKQGYQLMAESIKELLVEQGAL